MFVKIFLHYLLSLLAVLPSANIIGFLTCNTINIIYLIARKCCSKQYIGSATREGFIEKGKYLQAQLFTVTHGFNNMNKWFALNRQVYRK